VGRSVARKPMVSDASQQFSYQSAFPATRHAHPSGLTGPRGGQRGPPATVADRAARARPEAGWPFMRATGG
jgi:hypothetical protein